jgi:hypothetical protein
VEGSNGCSAENGYRAKLTTKLTEKLTEKLAAELAAAPTEL